MVYHYFSELNNLFDNPMINYRYFYGHEMKFYSPKGKNRYLEGKFTTDDKKTRTLKIVFQYSAIKNFITPEEGELLAKKINEHAKSQGNKLIEFKKKILLEFEKNGLSSSSISDKERDLFNLLIEIAPEKKEFFDKILKNNGKYELKEIELIFDNIYP